jgi:hypothetical protein
MAPCANFVMVSAHRPRRFGMLLDRAEIIDRAFRALLHGEIPAVAGEILRAEYPFLPISPVLRRYTEVQSLRVFQRDGFIDRYSGQRLVFPGIFRLLSRLLPTEFPYHLNWKMAETHPAYWELFPTIDHVLAVARGGTDNEGNCVTTSMLRNSAKANWTMQELGWNLRPVGLLSDWDGLTSLFVDFVERDRSVLEDKYLQRWYSAATQKEAEGQSGGSAP